jgi:hypothetical protein
MPAKISAKIKRAALVDVFGEDRRKQVSEQSFLEALKRADGERLADAFDDLAYKWDPPFLRSLARLPPISNEARALMLSVWIHWGDGWRNEVNNDLLLIDVLRNLLPPYTGEDVRLFRGESAFNRKRRTYGMSWTTDRSVAQSFAENHRDICGGGTVLLETVAPKDAIVCVPHLQVEEAHQIEAEYIVDRRRLRAVGVLNRLPRREPSEMVTRKSRTRGH